MMMMMMMRAGLRTDGCSGGHVARWLVGGALGAPCVVSCAVDVKRTAVSADVIFLRSLSSFHVIPNCKFSALLSSCVGLYSVGLLRSVVGLVSVSFSLKTT